MNARKPSPRNVAKRALDEALFEVRSCRDHDRRWQTVDGKNLARTLVKALLDAKDHVSAHPDEKTVAEAAKAARGADLAVAEFNAAHEIRAGARIGDTGKILFHGRHLADVRARLGGSRLEDVEPIAPEWPEGATDDEFLGIVDRWANGEGTA